MARDRGEHTRLLGQRDARGLEPRFGGERDPIGFGEERCPEQLGDPVQREEPHVDETGGVVRAEARVVAPQRETRVVGRHGHRDGGQWIRALGLGDEAFECCARRLTERGEDQALHESHTNDGLGQ